MRQTSILELLQEFEKASRVDQLIVKTASDGAIQFWPSLRVAVPSIIRQQQQVDAVDEARPEPADVVDANERETARKINGFRQVFDLVARGGRLPLIATRPEYHQTRNGVVEDKFVASFEKEGIEVTSVVFPGHGEAAWDTQLSNAGGIDAISWLDSNDWIYHSFPGAERFSGSATATRITPGGDALLREMAAHLAANLEELDEGELVSAFQDYCVSNAEWIAERTLLFEKMLRRMQPPIVFVACWYCPNGMALSRACSKQKVPYVDIQHGVIHPKHIAYAKWNRFPAGGYDLIPNWFWAWDAGSAKIVNQLEEGHSKSIVSGRVWSSSDIELEVADDKRWLNLKSQAESAKKVILVSTQFIEFEGTSEPAAGWQNLPEWMYEAIEEDHEVLWLFRAHPRVKTGASMLTALLSKKLTSQNWNVTEASALPGDAVIQLSDVNVTHSSSIVMEASERGIGTVFWGEGFLALYEGLVSEKWYRKANSLEEFRLAVKDMVLLSSEALGSANRSSIGSSIESTLSNFAAEPKIIRKIRRRLWFEKEKLQKRFFERQETCDPILRLLQIRVLLEQALKHPLKVVIGAESDVYPKWISTVYPSFDATNASCWKQGFRSNLLEAVLAEHVIEHLTAEHFDMVLRNVREFLTPTGHFRIAVPDGFNPDPDYIEYVRPGGSGAGCDDHKFLYNYQSMKAFSEARGFQCECLEWWDENGEFHKRPWQSEDGFIKRSADHDSRNANGTLGYTSLIVDLRVKNTDG